MVSGQWSVVSKLKFWMFLVFMASVILPESLRAEVIDRVMAVVNGKVITLSELMEREAPLVKQAAETFSGAERDKRLAEIRKKVSDSLIEDLLLEQEAEKLGLKVSERDIDDAIEDVKKQNSLDDEGLKVALKKEGLTYEGYRAQIKKQIEKSRVIGQQVRSKVSVSEKDLADYYEKNHRMFLKDEEVKISHILFVVPEMASGAAIEGIKKEAMDVLDMARSGKDFQELAKKNSEDSSAQEGGSLGFFKRGQILPAFEEAAFSLKKGEISDLVRTTYGFHIIRVDDVKEALLEPFESVKEKIRSTVTSEMLEQRYKEWMDELKKSAIIEVKL
ncbi:MAG: PpiC-type peptidyl-prolyl cis-trans isomerase [Deltaproteobacteria bacterium]|nr:PpiC-type peptidyl-prolyl cis-trans isomerase [Deltaproteobacteria bacterium]